MKRSFKTVPALLLCLLVMIFVALPNAGAFIPNDVDFTLPDTLHLLTKPSVPSGLSASTISGTEIDLSWTDKSANETGFFVHRKTDGVAGFTTIANLGANVTIFHDTGLTEGTKYYYVVSAFNSVGSSNFSDEASATTSNAVLTKPIAPTLLTAVASSDSQIELNWQNNCTTEKGFYIYRKTASDTNFTKVHDTGTAQWNGYGDSNLESGTKYYYYVSAYNAVGAADSNVLSATTTGSAMISPLAPSGLQAEAVSSSAIQLSWNDNSINENGFVLERSFTQAGGFTELLNLPNGSTSYEDKGLTAETTYYYRIKAFNDTGESDYSTLANAKTMQQAPPLPGDDNSSTTIPPSTPGDHSTVLRFYIDSCEYYINASAATMDAPPVIKDGRTLLPIRYVTTPLGAALDWNETSKKITISNNGTVIELWIGKNTALVNGVEKLIDPDNKQVVPVILPPGRTMLPLRFISENMGCLVDWNESLKEAKVTTK